jgi:glucose-6-phosphate isomerase
MLLKVNPTTTIAWQLLQQHYQEMKTIQIKQLFSEERNRFEKFSLSTPDIICLLFFTFHHSPFTLNLLLKNFAISKTNLSLLHIKFKLKYLQRGVRE